MLDQYGTCSTTQCAFLLIGQVHDELSSESLKERGSDLAVEMTPQDKHIVEVCGGPVGARTL